MREGMGHLHRRRVGALPSIFVGRLPLGRDGGRGFFPAHPRILVKLEWGQQMGLPGTLSGPCGHSLVFGAFLSPQTWQGRWSVKGPLCCGRKGAVMMLEGLTDPLLTGPV